MKQPDTAANGWERIERGWWTHERIGGVVQEGRGWGCYPLDIQDDAPARTAQTLAEAMAWMETRHSRQGVGKAGGG